MITKAERTRQYIIEKTAPIFNAKGFAGTSLSDIAEATGLTKGSIYGNFANKDEVALAAFDHNLKLVSDGIRALQQQYTSPLDKIRACVDFYRDSYRFEYMHAGCPIANAGTEADDTHPLLSTRVKEALSAWRRSLEKLVQRAIDAGELKADTKAADFSVLFISMIEGGVMLSKATGDRSYLTKTMKYVDTFVDMHCA